MTPDFINGLFEFFGGVLLWLNVRRLWRDRSVKGVSWVPVVFWAAWGAWNLFFYPAVGCWWSFAGGLFVVTANAAWLVLLLWVKRRGEPLKKILREAGIEWGGMDDEKPPDCCLQCPSFDGVGCSQDPVYCAKWCDEVNHERS